MRFAPKCLAFCTKIDRVLHQNTSRLAPKYAEFSDKQPKNGYELRFYAMCIHFTCIYNSPLFAPKQTLARIDFLRQVGDWWTKKALRMLNFLLKTRQNNNSVVCTHMATARKTRTLTTASANGCRT